jgi:Sec-independent protein secretion pathway components
MMFIFLLALILFGPKKLPEIGRQIGKGLAEFKRASREFQSQIEDEVRNLEFETEFKNTIAPPSLTNTVPAETSALTVSAPEIAAATQAPPSIAEAAAAAGNNGHVASAENDRV